MKGFFEKIKGNADDHLFVAGDMPQAILDLFNSVDYSKISKTQLMLFINFFEKSIKQSFELKKLIGLMRDRKFKSEVPKEIATALNAIDYEKTDRTLLQTKFKELKKFITPYTQ